METIQIPEGYVIDTEKSNERQIVLKKIEDRVKSWEEYCKKMKGKDSYYIDDVFKKIRSSHFDSEPQLSEFEDKEEAEAFAALGKLRKLRKDWIGEWKPDYKNHDVEKFTIIAADDEVTKKSKSYYVSSSMSFPTEKMRDEFFDTFRDLLEQAKTLL